MLKTALSAVAAYLLMLVVDLLLPWLLPVTSPPDFDDECDNKDLTLSSSVLLVVSDSCIEEAADAVLPVKRGADLVGVAFLGKTGDQALNLL